VVLQALALGSAVPGDSFQLAQASFRRGNQRVSVCKTTSLSCIANRTRIDCSASVVVPAGAVLVAVAAQYHLSNRSSPCALVRVTPGSITGKWRCTGQLSRMASLEGSISVGDIGTREPPVIIAT